MNDAKVWVEAINNEEKLRLRWFLQNVDNLKVEPIERAGTQDLQDELVRARKKLMHDRDVRPRVKAPEGAPTEDTFPVATTNMQPVPEEVTRLLYTSSNEGRKKYLSARNRVLPENRYYFPELTSFQYGWKMWDCAKTMEASKYGKMAVVRQTFYRRRAGIQTDPDWYRNPARTSPTICNCS